MRTFLVLVVACAAGAGCGGRGVANEGDGTDGGTAPLIDVVKAGEYIVEEDQAPTVGVPAGLPVGITADLVVVARDPDGGEVTYTYSSSCPDAVFTPPGRVGPAVGTGATPHITRFFLPDPRATCSVRVAVTDRWGATATGQVFLSSAPPATGGP